MKRVYVAGAYSSDNVIGVLDNIREGLRWSLKVFLAGHAPFAPWLDFHYQLMLRDGEQLSVDDYYRYSIAWMLASDVVFVIPGWDDSKGVRREIDIAKEHGTPVVFKLDDI